jgi:MFS family permease
MIRPVSGSAARAPSAMPAADAVSETRLLLAARGLRAIGDGSVSLLLPVYLLELGYRPFETGVIATATLAGSALLTLLVGLCAHRASGRSLLIGAALLMMLTGIAFATFADFWPLLFVAFVGTLNPSSGDVSYAGVAAIGGWLLWRALHHEDAPAIHGPNTKAGALRYFAGMSPCR